MKYTITSTLAERICKEIGWHYEIRPLKVAERSGQVHVKGTALKPDEARKLESFCATAGYKYHGPLMREKRSNANLSNFEPLAR